MIKYKILSPLSGVVIFAFVALSSCNNNSGHIPFPEKELGYTQPVTIPLKFTEEKKLIWDTAKKGAMKPVTLKLDIDALPSKPFDSTGFKTFSKPPEETSFNYNSLSDTTFDFDKLPSHSLAFTHNLLGVIASVKAALPSYQKDKPVSIADFGTAQGFTGKFISCLYQDKQGLLWIGCRDGIFRYDGDRIEAIVPKISAPIAGMAEDKKGRIWYVHSKGLGVIDMHQSTVFFSRNITTDPNNIAPIMADDKGLLWVGNLHDTALSVIDPETLTYKNISTKHGLHGRGGFQVAEDENKNIWVPTYTDGINIIDLKLGKIKYLKSANGLRSDSLSAITRDKAGKMWVATLSSFSRVEAIDVKTGTIKHYTRDQGIEKNLYTFLLSFDNKGRLWRSTIGGVEIIDLEKGMRRFIDGAGGLTGTTVLYSVQDKYNRMWLTSITGINVIDNNAETAHPFGQTVVTSLMEDEQGIIWTATRGGLTIIDPKKKLTRFLNTTNGLSNDFVQSFFLYNHKMLICTNGGINVIDPVRKTIERMGKKEGLLNDTCYAIFKDKEGTTWLTGPSNGIDRIDSAYSFILHTDATRGLSDNNISDIREDKEGFLWLATNSGGIDLINIKTGTVKYLNSAPGLKGSSNKSLLFDKYNRMWIGTSFGVYIADTKRGTLTSISTKNGLASDQVLSLLEYKGSVIAGTNIGSTIITAPLPGDASALSDTLGNHWKISPLAKTQAFQRLQAGSWNTDAVTAKGEYLWGDNGITWLNDIVPGTDSVGTFVTGMTVMTQPQHFKDDYSFGEKDTLRTTDTFYVKDRKPLYTGYTTKGLSWDTVSGPFNLPSGLKIPYNKNYIQFQFAQANLSRPDSTFYTYVLEGIDKNWSAVTNYPYTQNYLNLPSGKYTFKVSSKGISGRWSEPASFSFTITPPWYRTWWAYTLMALIAAAILRVYIVYRSRKLQQENKILEEKVTLRTQQLQKSLEELKATQTQLVQSEKMASLGELTAGIAHEIQNPLNFVNNFSEVSVELAGELKDELGKIEIPADKKANLEDILDDIVQNQEKINFHGKRADSIVKGMLQHSRSNSGIKEPTDINALADEYLRLSYHGLRAKDNSFNALMKTDFDKSLKPVNIIPQDIGRVILNLFTNAFYAVSEKKTLTQKGYEPTVSVSTKMLANRVEIRVRDNGMGVPQKVSDKIFQPFFTTKPAGQGTGLGLSLSYDIIKAHGGEIKVETKEGEFTEFVIQLPVSV